MDYTNNSRNGIFFNVVIVLMFTLVFLIIGFQAHDIEVLEMEISLLKEINTILGNGISIVETLTSDIITDFNDSYTERRLLLLDFYGEK